MEILFIVFLYGIVIGSFLNVCIYRIPLKSNIATVRSHCMNCGYNLKWYDLIPIFSYLFLKGKCRKCNTKISIQYPLIEGLNGVLYVIVFLINGFNYTSILYCLAVSALIVLSVIDFHTYEIPFGVNVFLFFLGAIRLFLDLEHWFNYLIGFFCVSGFLLILFLLTKGRGIGGGDVKLMASAGLLLGWKNIAAAFLIGCITGSVIHLIRMKVSKEDHVLAMGPYLSLGIFIAMLFGEKLIAWYFNFLI